MKIVLINPPRFNEIRADNPSFIDEERGYNPPLGILYLASYLQQNANYPIKIIDAQAEKLNYDEEFKKRIPVDDDLVVGITAMTFTMIDVIKTIKLLREVEKKSLIKMKIVLGGPHTIIYPKETIEITGVDYVVVGEGEVPFFELCEKISQEQKPLDVKGVVFKNENGIIDNGVSESIKDLDIFPFPARHLTDIKKYYSVLSGNKIVTTMFTSRGCPFPCTFCDRPQYGKKFRARSAKNVVDEMAACVEMGIEEVMVYDDTFTVNRRRVIDICDEIVSRGLKFSWDIRTRVDTVDEDMLTKLSDSGCKQIHFGVEAGTEKILKILNKGISVEQIEKVFNICRQLKMKTLAYFMIGMPTETKEDIEESVKLAKKLKPEFVHITILTPYPATAIYEQALAGGVIKNDYWREFARHPEKGVVTKYWEENFSQQELFDLLDHFYSSFYGRPSYILSNLLKIRSFNEFRKKLKMGFKVLGIGR